MISQAEKKGKTVFDWNAFFAKTNFTIDEIANASSLAGDWITCACGQQCSVIPRGGPDGSDSSSEPMDPELSELGMKFYKSITRMYSFITQCYIPSTANLTGSKRLMFDVEVAYAKDLLILIEKRSAQIIEDINNQLNYELV